MPLTRLGIALCGISRRVVSSASGETVQYRHSAERSEGRGVMDTCYDVM